MILRNIPMGASAICRVTSCRVSAPGLEDCLRLRRASKPDLCRKVVAPAGEPLARLHATGWRGVGGKGLVCGVLGIGRAA